MVQINPPQAIAPSPYGRDSAKNPAPQIPKRLKNPRMSQMPRPNGSNSGEKINFRNSHRPLRTSVSITNPNAANPAIGTINNKQTKYQSIN